MTAIPNQRAITVAGRCKYCKGARKSVRVGRMDLGAFNKPGILAYVCDTCDKFSGQPTTMRTEDGPESELQES